MKNKEYAIASYVTAADLKRIRNKLKFTLDVKMHSESSMLVEILI